MKDTVQQIARGGRRMGVLVKVGNWRLYQSSSTADHTIIARAHEASGLRLSTVSHCEALGI